MNIFGFNSIKKHNSLISSAIILAGASVGLCSFAKHAKKKRCLWTEK